MPVCRRAATGTVSAVRGARLPGRPGLWDVRWEDETIVAVEPAADAAEPGDIPAGGDLLSPPFVNPHLHLDKALLARQMAAAGEDNRSQTLQEAVERTWRFKAAYTEADLVARGTAVLHSALAWGTGAVRAFADVDPIVGLRAVEGLLALKARVADWMTLQVVAFPQEGILRAPGTAELLERALQAGADVVGGLPWYEWSAADMRAHVDQVLDLAQAYDRDVHMLVDDTDDASSRSLEYLALATWRRGLGGRVTASHCGALAYYDDAHAARVIELVRRAGVAVVSNAHISLVMAARHGREPLPRGITRVRQLLEAGVLVACGQDDVLDPYYPFGKASQAEVAWSMAHVAQLTRGDQVETVWAMVTEYPARILGLPDYGLQPGARADFVLHRGESPQEVLRLGLPPRVVVYRGRVAAASELTAQGPWAGNAWPRGVGMEPG